MPSGATLAIAIVLFTVWDPPTLAAFVPAYLFAWACVEGLARREVRFGARGSIAFALAGGAGLVVIAMRSPALLAMDQLADLPGLVADRARLQELPAIAPPLVSSAGPQTFHVFAPDAARVSVRFGDGATALPARALGHGLFRLDYDPRRDGPPSTRDGAFEATLLTGDTPHARTMHATTPLAHPRAFCADPSSGIAAAPSEETDQLFIISRDGTLRTAATADGPVACAVLPALHAIAVAHRHAGILQVIDWSSGQVLRELSVPVHARALASSPGADLLAMTVEEPPALVTIDPASNALHTSALPFRPGLAAFAGTRARIAVAGIDTLALHLLQLDPAGDAPPTNTRELVLGRPAVALAASPDGSRWFVAVTDYRPQRDPGPNHHVEDTLLAIDTDTLRLVTHFATTAKDADGTVIAGASPMQLAPIANTRVLAACAGTDDLRDFDLSTETGTTRPWPTGQVSRLRPYGVGDLGEGRWALSFPALAAIVVIDEHQPELVREHQLAPQLSSQQSEVRSGELAFWESTRSGASCQTCHTDADTDHALHDIGQATPRPTLTVRGTTATAPYLRGASYAQTGQLEHFAATVLGGYREDQPQRARSLEKYIAQLPLHERRRRSGTTAAETEQAGLDVFVRARCPTCHAFPAFTDLAQYPASFLFPDRAGERELLDTPSLSGVAARAPYYLHDAGAATLAEVLGKKNPAQRHGDLAELNERERRVLLDFVESL